MTLFPGVRYRNGKAMLLSLLALAIITVLSACGGNGTPTSGNKQGGTLTVIPSPLGDFTRNFDVYAANPAYGTQGMVYETLLYFNRLDGSIKPWLASSYSFSSDAKSITFNLRQGVKWTDGKPLTADDVAFSINILHQYPGTDANGLWKYIDTVGAPDSQTVKVHLKSAFSPILWYLGGQTYIVPQHIWSTIGDPTKFANPNPVGSGPFLLNSFTPQLLDYKRNPNYWQPGKPSISELRYPSSTSNTNAELLLAQGQVNWAGIFASDIQKTFVNRDPAHNHYWFPGTSVQTMYLNTAKFPFSLLPVRQAISLAIDRDQLSKVGEFNYEAPAHPTALVLPSNKSFLSSDYANSSFAVDDTKATSLLESAGFKKGSDGIYADSKGRRLAFNFNVVDGWTDWVTDCQLIAGDLKKIGMQVSVNAVSFNSYYSAMQLGSFDTVMSWTTAGPTPYYLYNTMLSSANTAAVGKTAASNWERWSDPTTDQYLNQYASSLDKTVQQQAIAGIQKIMVEQLPTIPLLYNAQWYEYNTSKIVGWPDANNTYAVPSPYSFPDAEVVALTVHQA